MSPNSRAKNRRVSSGIMDMNVVDDERHDPSLRISQPTYTNFDIGDYLMYNQDPRYQSAFGSQNTIESEEAFILKTEAFYMIKFE